MCYILGYARTAYAPDGTRTGVYEFYKSEWLSYLWAWFTGIDMLVSSLFRIYLPLARGKVLIVDRYVADAYVDLLCDTSIRNNGNRSLRFLLRLLPQESELLFLDVEEQEAVRRKTDILDRECLTARRKIYAELAVRLDGYRIDTTHISLQTVCEEIIKVLDWGTTS
jgi:thymidylate kinase